MEKRTSPRAIYDASVRWIAGQYNTAVEDRIKAEIAEWPVTRLVADVFDADPMAVAKHVQRVRQGIAPPMFFMPKSHSARKARGVRLVAQGAAIQALEKAGVAPGTEWWSDAHDKVVVEGVRGNQWGAIVNVRSLVYGWACGYRAGYFLEAFTRVLPVEVQGVAQ
jgi:hypothetical protein